MPLLIPVRETGAGEEDQQQKRGEEDEWQEEGLGEGEVRVLHVVELLDRVADVQLGQNGLRPGRVAILRLRVHF